MLRIPQLLVLTLLLLLPQGITGEVYSTGAAEIAGALGLSGDEASWLKTLNMMGQLMTLPLAAWLARRLGYRSMTRLGALIGLVAALLACLCRQPAPQLLAWWGHGVSASLLLLVAHGLVLRGLGYRAIALVEGAMLLGVVLIPMGLYPLLLAHLAEESLWHWAFAAQVPVFLALLYWTRFGPWFARGERSPLRFNLLQALLLSGFIGGLTYLLLRGERFDWFQAPHLVTLGWLLLGLGGLTVLALRRRWGGGAYLRPDLLAAPLCKAGMLDAVMAGFVILGTNQLVTVYVTQAMGYSHVELGRMELVGFVGMLAGLLIALYATTNPARDPEKVIPIGIVLMLTACCLLTGRSAGSGFDDFWPALLLKGVAVGILNITLTVHVLRSLPWAYLDEGVAWFYLFRNLGSLLAVAQFSHLMHQETSQAVNRLGEHYNSASQAFLDYQQAAAALGQEAAPALLAKPLHTQAMAVAGVNNVQWFLFTLAFLIPVVIGTMRWAHHKSQQGE